MTLAAEAQRYLAAVDLLRSLDTELTWHSEAVELGALPHMDELCGGMTNAPDRPRFRCDPRAPAPPRRAA